MATLNGTTQKRSFDNITNNNYTVDHLNLNTSQPQKKHDYGFLFDIPYPLSVSAGWYNPNTLGDYPSDSVQRNIFVKDLRPNQKFFFNTVRQKAAGKPVEPYKNPNYAFQRSVTKVNI